MFMLDTNTLIYFFKGIGRVKEHLFSYSPKDIFIPSIVIYELQVGIAKSNSPKKREKQLSTILKQINIIEFGEKEAKISALIRADLERKGTPIGAMDILIAGCAKAHNLTLITHNTKEFMRVEGLSLNDWF